jgi:hypothetical protein
MESKDLVVFFMSKIKTPRVDCKDVFGVLPLRFFVEISGSENEGIGSIARLLASVARCKNSHFEAEFDIFTVYLAHLLQTVW